MHPGSILADEVRIQELRLTLSHLSLGHLDHRFDPLQLPLFLEAELSDLTRLRCRGRPRELEFTATGTRSDPAPFLQIVVVVALTEDNPTLALEGQYTGAHPVEEIAVMAHHQHAPGKERQRLLQNSHGLQIEVIGRLVQDQEIAAPLEHSRQ